MFEEEESRTERRWEDLSAPLIQRMVEVQQAKGTGWRGDDLKAVARTCIGWSRSLHPKERAFWESMYRNRWKISCRGESSEVEEEGMDWCKKYFDAAYGRNFERGPLFVSQPTLRAVFGEGRLRITSIRLLGGGYAFASMDGRVRVCQLAAEETDNMKRLARETSIMTVHSVSISHGKDGQFLCVVGQAWANNETCKVDIWYIDSGFSSLALCMSFHEEGSVTAACTHPSRNGGLAHVFFGEKRDGDYLVKLWAASGLRVRSDPVEVLVKHEISCLTVADGHMKGSPRTLLFGGTHKGRLLIWSVDASHGSLPSIGSVNELPLSKHIGLIAEVKATYDQVICLGKGSAGNKVIVVVQLLHNASPGNARTELDFTWKTWSINSHVERPLDACFMEESIMVLDTRSRLWSFQPGSPAVGRFIHHHDPHALLESGHVEKLSANSLAILMKSSRGVHVIVLGTR